MDRAVQWLDAHNGGMDLPWVLFWLTIPCVVGAWLLQDRFPWIWYPAAIPLAVGGLRYGLLRRRLNKLAKELGLICWHCGNIAVESPLYFRVQDPGGVVRRGRCLWCF